MNLGELKDKIKDIPDDTLVVFKSCHTVNDFEIVAEVSTGDVEPGTPPGYFFEADKDRDKTEDTDSEIQPAVILT